VPIRFERASPSWKSANRLAGPTEFLAPRSAGRLARLPCFMGTVPCWLCSSGDLSANVAADGTFIEPADASSSARGSVGHSAMMATVVTT
jgi:hypothetical protein